MKERQTQVFLKKQFYPKEVANKYPSIITKKCDISVAEEREELFQWISKNHPNLNGYLVTILAVDMKALETAELIEQAYQSGRVNEDFVGD